MSRVMTIWLPRWPVQRRLVERPELRKMPVFVCRRERRGVMTIVSWAWAEPPRRAGGGRRGVPLNIATGTSLAEGMAVLALAHGSRACHVAEVAADDPAADALALDRLARWCRRFSPTVGVEAPCAGAAAPECVRLDVAGTAGFFGGEEALARTAVWTLAARGLHARVGIADTGSASWAAAHHPDLAAAPGAACGRAGRVRRRSWAVVPPGAAATALAGLPAAALRLDAATLAALGEVGIDTVGGMLRLSARSLAARFPPDLARRRAEFLGQLAEPPLAPRGDELPRAAQAFDVPLAATDLTADAIRAVLERLVESCVAPLAARGEGVLMLQVRLEAAVTTFDGGGSWSAAAPAVVDVGLFRPSGSVRHLVDLVMLRLDRCRPPHEIGSIAVEVVAAAAAACRQRSLFAGVAAGADDDAETAAFLDRLAGRLGRAAVFEPRPVADPQPEHAWLAAPPGTSAAGTATTAVAAGRRPVWLAPKPVPLAPVRAGMVSVAPDGPPVRFRLGGRLHVVARALGPERIETAWWRGPTVRRDYYVVETESGERLWMFRGLRDGGWFLHGVFA